MIALTESRGGGGGGGLGVGRDSLELTMSYPAVSIKLI